MKRCDISQHSYIEQYCQHVDSPFIRAKFVHKVVICDCNLQAVTLHTDVGDLKIELNCEDTPKACEVVLFNGMKFLSIIVKY